MEGEGDDDGVIGEIAGEWDALERTRPGGRNGEDLNTIYSEVEED